MSFISEDQKSLSKLAQIFNALKYNFALHRVVKIITKEGDINCRIPSWSSIKSSDPLLAGGTALHVAFSRYNFQVVEALLRVGADYTIKNDHGSTPLHCIIGSDFYSLSNIEKLRKKPFVDAVLSEHVASKNSANPRNKDGLSHLHLACMVNHISAVEFFLRNGEDVDQAVDANASCNAGYTPLHFAVKCYATEASQTPGENVFPLAPSSFDTIKILLERGANISSMDSKGMTPSDILLDRKIQIYDSTGTDKEIELNTSVLRELKVNEDITNLLLEKIASDSLIIDDKGLSRFHVACTSQDTSTVESMLEEIDSIDHAVSANSRVWPGYTGLHFAAHCNVDTVKILLARGADLQAKDARGVSPFDICLERFKTKDIHAIVSQYQAWKNILLSDGKTKLLDVLSAMENPSRLKRLLQSSLVHVNERVPINSQLWPEYTLLHLAVTLSERHKKNALQDYSTEPDIALVKECLDDGADVTMKDSRGWTPLHLAYRQGKMRIVGLLLHCHHVLANPSDEDNLSHLHIACAAQNEVLVENLLLRTGDVGIVYKGSATVRSIKPGYTPLHVAVAKRNLKIVEILMRHGADVNAADFNGCTPIHETLHLADKKGIVEILFSSSALRECANGVGLSHLHVASENNEVDVVERLLKLGASIDAAVVSDDDSRLVPDRYEGCTALHVAVMCRALDVVIFLLERGADILAKSSDGSTPLSKSLDDENGSYIRYFVRILRADVDLQARMVRETGVTMLHLACHLVNVDEVSRLSDGAIVDVNARVNEDSAIWPGCTPLHVLLFRDLECPKQNGELSNRIYVCLETLLNRRADVTLANVEGDTPLHVSFKLRDDDARYSRVRQLMTNRTDLGGNPLNANRLSHFHLACLANDPNCVEKFLRSGADANEPIDFFADNYPGCSPLHLAVGTQSGWSFASVTRFEVVDLLLRYEADVRAENSHGYTALHNAARLSPSERGYILEKILGAGGEINNESIHGETPFEVLLHTNEISAGEVQFFVDHGARINSCNPHNDQGYLSMLLSKKLHANWQTDAFEVMMKTPDIGVVNEMGRNAIHNAVTASKPNISTDDCIQLIRRLTTLGFDVEDQDKYGWTALHLAAQFGNKEATAALLRSGVDVNIIDTSNKSAFSYAIEICRKCQENQSHRHTDVIQVLALHIHKLQILDLEVSQLNANLKNAMCPNVDVENKFQDEVDVMRELKIGKTNLVAIDFMSESKVVDYPYMSEDKRNEIDQFFESIDACEIGQLEGILKLQHRKAVKRLQLIQPSITAFRSLLGFPLPELICDRIFKCLRNADLKNLIQSAGDDV